MNTVMNLKISLKHRISRSVFQEGIWSMEVAGDYVSRKIWKE